MTPLPVAAPRIDTAALRRAHPVARVVAHRYGSALRPVGRALVGRCPLHPDGDHPNLHVYPAADPAADGWFCYRCGVGGDVVDLVRLREFQHLPEGTGFLAACAALAGGSGAPAGGLVPPAPAPPIRRRGRAERRWDRLTLEEQEVMNTAWAAYRRALWRAPAALAYLRERAVPDWVIRTCGLGFADGRSLEGALRHESARRIARELGLLRGAAGGGGDLPGPLREALAGRIVVPEVRYGQCVWLIGRDLPVTAAGGAGGDVAAAGGTSTGGTEGPVGRAGPAPTRPKYLALGGERPVLGVERAAGRRVVFLCEGVVDYLTAVAWRLPACSPCGTALPAERLGFLARARVVYGVLDGDAAGRAAAGRLGAHLGARFRSLRLPEGYDLNDLGRHPGGREAFFRLLAAAQGSGRRSAGDAGAAGPARSGGTGYGGERAKASGATGRPACPDHPPDRTPGARGGGRGDPAARPADRTGAQEPARGTGAQDRRGTGGGRALGA